MNILKIILKQLLFYTLAVFFALGCDDNKGAEEKAEKATTPETGIVKLLCECQNSQTTEESPSIIQGQGDSKTTAEQNALEKCKKVSSQSSVNNCEEIKNLN